MNNTKCSADAPLNFANKNLETLLDLKMAVPRQGTRKSCNEEEPSKTEKKEENIQVQQITQVVEEQDENKMDEDEKEKDRERREKERQKEIRGIPVIVRKIGQPIVQTTLLKPILDDKQQLTKEKHTVPLVQTSLILSYNKLTSISNFYNVIDSITNDCRVLQWIDLSHNLIDQLDYNFAEFPLLKSLYLHANQLKDIGQLGQLERLPYLRTLTVHGNPLDSIPQFRLHILGLLPRLKTLDSVVITKKELDNALVWRNTFKVLSYEPEGASFIVKAKWGTQVQQTAVGNNWNHKFILEKRKSELKVEVWEKKGEFQFVGEAIVALIGEIQQLDIVCNSKKEGTLLVSLKEAPRDPQLIQMDADKLHKLEGPQKLVQRLNDSLSMPASADYVSVQDYFSQHWNDPQLQGRSEAEQFVKQSFKKASMNLHFAQTQHFEFEAVVEDPNIQKLQKQLIRNDLKGYEKTRREIAIKILDLDEMELRVDQGEQKATVAQLRKELTQKLLYMEDKIEHLKRTLKSQQHHVFAANPNLPNSQIEMSQISIQRDFLTQWEQDPQKAEERRLFVQKQMKEWHDLQEQREKKLQDERKRLADLQQRIKQEEQNKKAAQTQERRKEAEKKLAELEVASAQRKQAIDEANRRYEEKRNQKHLAQKYAEQDALYMQRIQEERTKLIQARKTTFDLDKINKFDEQFLNIQQANEKKRRKQWEDREEKWNKFKAQYYSDSYSKAKESYKLIQHPFNEQLQKAQEKLQMRRAYEDEVKEKHKPTVSVAKQQEMEEIRSRIKYESDFKKYRELSEKVKMKHKFNGVKPVKIHRVQLKPLEDIPVAISPRRVGEFYLKHDGTFNTKHLPPKPKQIPQTSQSEQKLQINDYLKEQRIKRQLKQGNGNPDQILTDDDIKMVQTTSIRTLIIYMNQLIKHCFSTLLYVDHAGGHIAKSTYKVLNAAKQLNQDITILIASDNTAPLLEQAKKTIKGVKVITAQHASLKSVQAETITQVIQKAIDSHKFTQVVTSTSTLAKDFLPRVAVKYLSQPITDVIQIKGDTFIRPIYAGNALSTVKSNDKIKFLSFRPTNFEEAGKDGAEISEVTELDVKDIKTYVEHIKDSLVQGDKPELTSAKFVVSGGRGLQSRENFKILDELAEALGNTAIGASRAAVDAGYANNDQQVGQTGKVVAPELYIAVGISGAIQHLAGMKDSKVIVAINKDAEAPIVSVADYTIVGDLFKIVPELTQKLKQ